MVRKKVRWEDEKGIHVAYEGTRAYKERSGEKEKEVTQPTQPTPIKLQQPIKAEKEKGFVGKALEAQKKIITSPVTTVVLGTIAAALATAGLSTIPTAASLGTRVGSILHTASIHHWSKATGMLVAKKGITISKVPILQTAGRIGQPTSKGINLLFKAGSRFAINQKTTALATSIVSKSFSTKAMAIYGTWAGSVFLGKWGQAEAPEPIMIPLRDALRQAEETGDWSIYDEYLEAAKEIANVSMWENILSYSPISAIPGILAKIKGVKKGVELLDAIAEKEKEVMAEKALEEPEPTFAEQRAAADEEARQRDLLEMQWKSDYYKLIREGKFEEAEELLQSQ